MKVLFFFFWRFRHTQSAHIIRAGSFGGGGGGLHALLVCKGLSTTRLPVHVMWYACVFFFGFTCRIKCVLNGIYIHPPPTPPRPPRLVFTSEWRWRAVGCRGGGVKGLRWGQKVKGQSAAAVEEAFGSCTRNWIFDDSSSVKGDSPWCVFFVCLFWFFFSLEEDGFFPSWLYLLIINTVVSHLWTAPAQTLPAVFKVEFRSRSSEQFSLNPAQRKTNGTQRESIQPYCWDFWARNRGNNLFVATLNASECVHFSSFDLEKVVLVAIVIWIIKAFPLSYPPPPLTFCASNTGKLVSGFR